MLSDKDATGYLRSLRQHLDGIVTYPLSHRAVRGGRRLRKRARGRGLPSASRKLPGRMAARPSLGREGGRRARVRLSRRRGGRLSTSRRFRGVNRFHRAVVGLLLLVAGVVDVSAEARFPNPSTMKELSKRGIRLDAPVHMTADTISYDEETGVAVAEGNVRTGVGNADDACDRIRYDRRRGRRTFPGRCGTRTRERSSRLTGSRSTSIRRRGSSITATILISSSNFLIASGKIEKTGKSSFLVEKGSMTTCPCDPEPDWKFEVNRARVTLDPVRGRE